MGGAPAAVPAGHEPAQHLRSLRTARRYLTNLCRLDPRTQSAAGPLVSPPNRNRFPANIWLITELTWEPYELIPEMEKIGRVFTTDLSPARQGAATRTKVAELVDQARPDMRPDLIWLYAREGLLSEDIFRVLRNKFDVPIWGMNSDDKADFFPREHAPYAGRDGYGRWVRHFDMNLSVCRAMMPHYLAAGARYAYSPEGLLFPAGIRAAAPAGAGRDFLRGGLARGPRRAGRAPSGAMGSKSRFTGVAGATASGAEAPWKIFRASQMTLGDGVSFGLPMTNLKGRDFEAPARMPVT
ncbi:MAG: hypothetical protein WDO13_04065 [Verrucomicrobiota bacterium]